MLAIIAKFDINPDHVDAFFAAVKKIIEPTRAEKGCMLYGFSRDAFEDNVIWATEQWETEEDLIAHLRTDNVKRLLAETEKLDIRGLDARQYEVSSVGPVVIPD